MTPRLFLALGLFVLTQAAVAAKVPSTFEFSASSYSVNETDGTLTITVNRSGSTSGPASVHYSTSNGTAIAGWDYVSTSGTLSWVSNDGNPKSFTVAILDDWLIEDGETFNLSLSSPSKGELGVNSQATVEIHSEDRLGSLQFSAASYGATEGNGAAVITVERVGGKAGEVSVYYSSADDTALADKDYEAVSGTLTWANGDDSPKSFSVPFFDDNVSEPNETVSLELRAASGAALGEPSNAILTIVNDDQAGTLQFSDIVYHVTESRPEATITVTRTWGSDGYVTVEYSTADGTATQGSDYAAVSGILSWAHGDTVPKTFTVPLQTDGVRERDESIVLVLSNVAGGATLGNPYKAMLKIADADQSSGHIIDASGGDGGRLGGRGVAAAAVSILKEGGTGSLEVLKTGSVDASFTPTLAVPNLGPEPLIVIQDTYLPAIEWGPEPPAGTAYINAYDDFIRISDGDGIRSAYDVKVTGLEIAAGAVLRLGDNWIDSKVDIRFAYDVVNRGTITTDDLDRSGQRSGLNLDVANYHGDGMIDTSAKRDGQSGGFVYVYATGSIYNHGDINTYGGDSAIEDAGNGGAVVFWADQSVENTGRFFNRGGRSTAGLGGNGGGFSLRGNAGVANAAAHDNAGGDGITGGGHGGGFSISHYSPGEVRFSGTVDSAGGVATEGAGGQGGSVNIYVDGTTIYFAANVDSRGGDTLSASANGGGGGFFNVNSWFDDGGTNSSSQLEDDTPAGDILMAGSIITAGGSTPLESAGYGGWGGDVTVYLDARWHPRDQRLLVANLTQIRVAGGRGANGAEGNDVTLTSSSAWDQQAGGYTPGGDLINEADIITRGGNVVAGAVANDINGPGRGGGGGDVEFYAYNALNNSGDIDTSGGHDFGDEGGSQRLGGVAGHIYLDNTFGLLTNSGALTANGGDGLYGGGGTSLILFDGPQAVNSGDITADGGNADPAVPGSHGGSGGNLWFDVTEMLGQTGIISLKGGTGETPGRDGYGF